MKLEQELRVGNGNVIPRRLIIRHAIVKDCGLQHLGRLLLFGDGLNAPPWFQSLFDPPLLFVHPPPPTKNKK